MKMKKKNSNANKESKIIDHSSTFILLNAIAFMLLIIYYIIRKEKSDCEKNHKSP